MECVNISSVERRVRCIDNYNWTDTACVYGLVTPAPPVAHNSLEQGAYCQHHEECKGDMVCGDGARYICTCPAVYMRYDATMDRCIRREFGDVCTRDAHCMTYAFPWTNWWYTNFDGYNYREGRCVRNRCVCQGPEHGVNETRITYITDNGTLATKTVCVVSGATMVKNGDRCTLNPIGYGASTQTHVCPQGEICYQCPEEYPQDQYGVQAGTCRKPTRAITIDVQRIGKMKTKKF